MKSILDPSFRYTPSVNTDLKKTFARIRRAQCREDQTRIQPDAEPGSNVLPIQKRMSGGIEIAPHDKALNAEVHPTQRAWIGPGGATRGTTDNH
jgi:hypothetical protein